MLRCKAIFLFHPTGHATPVDTLLFIHPPSVENKGNLASRPYFISAARDDRVINIWQYNPDVNADGKGAKATTTTTTTALVSMTIPEEAQHLSLKQPDSIGEVSYVTRTTSGLVVSLPTAYVLH